MKIERRQYAVFIAHNRLAIFVNRGFDKDQNKPYYMLRINKGLSGLDGSEVKSWITIGEMRVEENELKDFLQELQELAK